MGISKLDEKKTAEMVSLFKEGNYDEGLMGKNNVNHLKRDIVDNTHYTLKVIEVPSWIFEKLGRGVAAIVDFIIHQNEYSVADTRDLLIYGKDNPNELPDRRIYAVGSCWNGCSPSVPCIRTKEGKRVVEFVCSDCSPKEFINCSVLVRVQPKFK